MLQGLIGKKVGMTQIFTDQGERIPVSVVQMDKITVIQKKTVEKEGYNAIQVGFLPIPEGKLKRVSKAKKGHFKGLAPTKGLKELKTDDIDQIEVGATFDFTIFEKGQLVDVVGTSKGKGFTGVMKRHNFSGGPSGHGHRFHRSTGSIGASASPSRVFKNKKMPGQHGNKQVTVQGLEIIEILPEKNAMLVKGGIPGPNGSIVTIKRSTKSK